MATFTIHLVGQHQPLKVDLSLEDVGHLAQQASTERFLVGHLAEPDEDGVCKRVMVATSRIQCAVESG